MAFTAVEIIALAVIIGGIIKMLVILVDPKAWMNFAKNIYSKPKAVSVVAFILAVIVLNYLLVEMTMVQILAVTAFVALLIIIGLAKEVPHFLKKYDAMIKKGNLWKEYWFYSLIWIILMVWGLWELFA